ncbi:DUF928 domain-containing protein [Coleofasciculus chthonoplastes]|uniref:DUF928 domain-containing protein n=1 Tax=Coleofasciculus chthonoplastes TaxID=64178 RepID=UPI0032F23F59
MTFTLSPFYHKLLTGTLVALLSSMMVLTFISKDAQAQGFGKPPGSTKSGGVRGECFAADRERPLMALVDSSEPVLTTQTHPTFLFYLPYSSQTQEGQNDGVTTAEFELLDEQENSVLKHQKIVVFLPENPGFVKLALPPTETELEPDKEYFWIFRIICDTNDNTANPSVSGWIKRVSVGSRESLWLDRLDQLIQSPTSRLEQWRQLLVEVDPELQNLAQTPIVELEPEASGTRIQEDNGCYYNQLPTRTYGAQ